MCDYKVRTGCLPDSWYEPDCTPEYDCCKCEEKERKFECAAEYLEAIVKQLYMTEKLDVELLKKDIEELCDIMDVKPYKNEIQVERKGDSMTSFLKEWTIYNNNYLKDTLKTGVQS